MSAGELVEAPEASFRVRKLAVSKTSYSVGKPADQMESNDSVGPLLSLRAKRLAPERGHYTNARRMPGGAAPWRGW